MTSKIALLCDRIIEYSFYLLFLLVPLIFTSVNYELFEFNKMILTYGLTVTIVGAFLVKSVTLGKIELKRTPLDIPILLFLAAMVASTLKSIDVHTSLWGYYSRFNGGLVSLFSYALLYFVFVNTMDIKRVFRTIFMSLFAGLLVVLWGLPSHFGFDPTCYLIQGNFDTSCWTESFKPEIRIFSTLGQPNWLGAYLSILIPIAMAIGISNIKSQAPNLKQIRTSKFQILKIFGNLNFKNWNLFGICSLGFGILFYLALLFTLSRSSFLGLWAGLLFFFGVSFFLIKNGKSKINGNWKMINGKFLMGLLAVFTVITFLIGTPFEQLNKFTLSNFIKPEPLTLSPSPSLQGPALETGGTESGKIRTIVWKGAINIARNYPIFGSGLETFAYSYYKFRPVEHNLTSEWDFLYNKAHNEYLNYAATTGFVGLGSYLLMIGVFLSLTIKKMWEMRNEKLEIEVRGQKKSHIPPHHPASHFTLLSSLLAGYASILVSNFFGFSVVITNLYLFLIPAFVFVLNGITEQKSYTLSPSPFSLSLSLSRLIVSLFIILASLFLILNIGRLWLADFQYAQGYTLDRTGQFVQGYEPLFFAVSLAPNEPTFQDELAFNNAMLVTLFGTEDVTSSVKLIDNAVSLSNNVVGGHPHNITFWKTRARIFYALSDLDEKYLTDAITSLETARKLAPTDARIAYNLGVMYGQNGQTEEAIKTLEETTDLKSDYRDAHFALALFLNEGSDRKRAIEQLEFILNNIASDDAEVKQQLIEWRGF